MYIDISGMKDYWSLLIFVMLLMAIVFLALYEYFSKCFTEGFISFQKNTQSLDTVTVPTYSPTSIVHKLYDNFYFDQKNGNLIQVNGLGYDASSNIVDNNGSSVDSIIVTKRDSSIQSLSIGTVKTTDNKVNNFASASSQENGYEVDFCEWLLTSSTTNTNNYQVLYIGWTDYTFIDVIDNTVVPAVSRLCAIFSDDLSDKQVPTPVPSGSTRANKIDITPFTYTSDSQDGKNIVQSLYNNRSVFQITSFLQFDTTNGNILFLFENSQNIKSYKLYDRNMNDKSQLKDYSLLESHIQNMPYSVHSFVIDPTESSLTPATPKFFIYYITFQQRTIIVVLNKQSSSTSPFTIVKVARFTNKGYVSSSNGRRNRDGMPGNDDYDYRSHSHGGDWSNFNAEDEPLNPYSSDSEMLLAAFLLREQMNYLDNNFIHKSQMVPPVFPVIQNCPSCGNGNCPSHSSDSSGNKGGGGGGGGGKSEGGGGGGAAAGFGNNLVNASTGLVNNVVDGAVDLTKTAVGETVDLTKAAGGGVMGAINSVGTGIGQFGSGAVNLAENAGSGALGAANSVVGGVVDLSRETIGGAVGLSRETIGGAVDLSKQAAGGAVDLTKQAAHGIGAGIGPLTGGQQGVGGGQQGVGGGQQGVQGTAPFNNIGPTPGFFGQPIVTSPPIQYNTNNVPGVDGYSYYGALPNKGSSDFMPLTASFANF